MADATRILQSLVDSRTCLLEGGNSRPWQAAGDAEEDRFNELLVREKQALR